MSRRGLALCTIAATVVAALGVVDAQLPGAGAGALLYPGRRPVEEAPPASCESVTFGGVDVPLEGWQCETTATTRRGTVIYLHGVADNRTSGLGAIQRFVPMGFDVVAFDSRAHGNSGGTMCTYGFYEKQDVRRILDSVVQGPVVLVGTSLGAAVALQTAAADARVAAVVAAETFSDLRTVATERAPVFFRPSTVDRAFRLAESLAQFQVDEVSPALAARGIAVPVLLIHGDADADTPADHSRRVFAALRGHKRLILVPAAGHNQSLRLAIWTEIEQWVLTVLASGRSGM